MESGFELQEHLDFKCSTNYGFHFLWGGERCKTLERLAVASDQELSEVPLDPSTQHAG